MVLGLIWIILKSVSPPPPLGGQWGDTHTVSSHHPLLSLSTPTIPMPSLSPPLPYPPHHRGVVTLPSAPAHDRLSPPSPLFLPPTAPAADCVGIFCQTNMAPVFYDLKLYIDFL